MSKPGAPDVSNCGYSVCSVAWTPVAGAAFYEVWDTSLTPTMLCRQNSGFISCNIASGRVYECVNMSYALLVENGLGERSPLSDSAYVYLSPSGE